MRNRSLAFNLAAIVAGMVMLTYASVPLYRIFCQVTGFGGTTREGGFQQIKRSNHTVTVSFSATMDPHLTWKFEPLEKSVTVHLGENRLIAFRATNLSNKPTRGVATYNVAPFSIGPYFNKIQCFCFEEQRLSPHESAILPVSFYIDPAMLNDKDARDITNITLSYTFFSYESANRSKLKTPSTQ
jgi:cytochrome c oxidase assembly protein subunit 11